MFEKNGSVDEQCQALVKLSQAYQALGEYNKALQNLERALAISKKSGNRARTASLPRPYHWPRPK
jgi:tetratricopeptide (TPR) repeat protein